MESPGDTCDQYGPPRRGLQGEELPGISPEAGRFVFFAWDTEKAQNAGLKKKYPVQALPSFFVVDPATETPALRWVGGATVPQMRKILDDGARALAARATEGLPAELGKADRLYAAGSDKEAAAAYRAVLGKAPKDWEPWGRAAESLLFALQRTGDAAGCAAFACEAWERLRTTSSSANVAAIGLECARGLPASDTGRVSTVAGFTKASREVLDSKVSVAPDDRSAVYDALLSERALAKVYGPRKRNVLRVRTDIYAGMGDKDAAKKTVVDWGKASRRSFPALKPTLRTISRRRIGDCREGAGRFRTSQPAIFRSM